MSERITEAGLRDMLLATRADEPQPFTVTLLVAEVRRLRGIIADAFPPEATHIASPAFDMEVVDGDESSVTLKRAKGAPLRFIASLEQMDRALDAARIEADAIREEQDRG